MKPFKLPHAATIVGLVVLGGILLTQRLTMKTQFVEHPMQLVLDRNIVMTRTTSCDDVIAKLRKGDTVSYLGAIEATYQHPTGLLVQTKDGLRGMLSTVELGFPMMLADTKDSLPIMVTVKGGIVKEKNKYNPKRPFLKYNIVKEDGKKEQVDLNDIRPILPDSLRKTQLKQDGDYYMTKDKFERLYIGKSLAETDRMYRPAWFVEKTKTGYKAFFPNIEVIDFEDGKMHNAIVEYDQDSIAIGYEFTRAYGNNRYIVKYMPLLGKIVDVDFFARIIETSLYGGWASNGYENYTEVPDKREWKEAGFWDWVAGIAYLVFGLIWLLCMGTLPMLICEALLYCRYTYYHLSDGAVASLFGLIALVTTYIWCALLTVWGFLWLFLFIPVIAGFWVFAYAERKLGNIPHDRCLKCRRMELVQFLKTEFVREYDEWRPDKVAIDSHTERWKTWTEVHWSDGSRTRKNEQNHSRTTTTYADYTVLYHVKEYENYYECQACGNIETTRSEKLHELDRHQVGTHVEVSGD